MDRTGGANNTLNCSESGTYSVPYRPEKVFASLKTVVPKIDGFTVINVSDSEMSLDIDVGMSLKSCGETIRISVSASSAYDSILSIISESKFATIDWGKNAENQNKIVDVLQKNLINFKAVHNNAASTGNQLMVSVLYGTVLFLLVGIVISFHIMEYEIPGYIWAGIVLMIAVIIWNNLKNRKVEMAWLQAETMETQSKDLRDADALVDQYLDDMNRKLDEIKAVTKNALEEEAHIEKLVNENKEEIKNLEKLAKTALLEGNELEAKAFLEKKARFRAQVTDLESAYAAACSNSIKMCHMCDKLTANITELASRREAIRVKNSIAKTQEAINAIAAHIDNAQGTEGAFALMEENTDKMVDQVNAMLELNEKPVDEAEILAKKYTNIGTKLVQKKGKANKQIKKVKLYRLGEVSETEKRNG